jgi:hypothetical protein
MIELVAVERDDAAFLLLTQRILNGAIAELQVREVFLVHMDNWFDYKWLGWWARKEDRELRIPMFTPNRVRSEKHFIWDVEWTAAALPRPLHIRQAGRPCLALPLDRFSRHALFAWYSGNTTINDMGSLIVYLSGGEGYAWYTSLRKDGDWAVTDELHITRRELVVFENRGREIEAAFASSQAKLAKLAAKAREDVHAGRFRTLGIDEL